MLNMTLRPPELLAHTLDGQHTQEKGIGIKVKGIGIHMYNNQADGLNQELAG